MDPKETNTQEDIDNDNLDNNSDDTELDKELEDTINSIKDGKDSQKEEDKPEEKEEEDSNVTQEEESSNPPAKEEEDEVKYEFKLPKPSKTKFESDEAYEKRVQLMDLIERKKAAKSSEQKAKLTDEIKETRKELSLLNPNGKINNPLNDNVDNVNQEDPSIKADRDRLKELGGATKEDVQELIKEQIQALEVKSNIDSFVNRHKEMSDPDVREVFFDFVDQNYLWQGKSGKDFIAVLEMAYENMFKPSETIQERVLKSANVQEKVNAMQFPGGTIAKTALPADLQKSVDELVATGMSEEKAIELISD